VRVLVIGGSGFIGGSLVRRLREVGAAPGSRAPGVEVATFHRGEGADVRGDRRELAGFREALARLDPECVVDTIAYSERDAAEAVAVFRGIARRLIVLSSEDVYAAYGRLLRLETGAPDPVPASEDAPLRASRFPYRAKARGPEDVAYEYEKILVEQAAAAEPELPATILRLPCVYGPADPHRRVGQVLDRMAAGGDFVMDRAKAPWRWTRGYVEDVAEAIALAATDPRAEGRTYNVGETNPLTEAEWISRIGKAASWRGEVRAVPREQLPPELAEPPFDHAHDLVADTSRIRRELGFRERAAPDEAMRRTVEDARVVR